MPNTIRTKQCAEILQTLCVACGTCRLACPRQAIQIDRGLYAKLDESRCVGCRLCEKACPASIISMKEVLV